MTFIEWYLIGFVSALVYVLIVNKHSNSNITYGNVAFVSIFGLFGPLITVTLVIGLFLMLVIQICKWDFWTKHLLKKSRYND